MYTIEQMNKWDYKTAWDFFNKNAAHQYIPESQTYVQSLKISKTIDIRDDSEAREKILQAVKSKTLILLENMIKEKSTTSVILVGSYLEVIHRSIIAKTLGRYFEQVVSIYCCAKRMRDLKFFMRKRDEEFGSATNPIMETKIIEDYKYAKRFLQNEGIALGIGMDASFIADISVINMFE